MAQTNAKLTRKPGSVEMIEWGDNKVLNRAPEREGQTKSQNIDTIGFDPFDSNVGCSGVVPGGRWSTNANRVETIPNLCHDDCDPSAFEPLTATHESYATNPYGKRSKK